MKKFLEILEYSILLLLFLLGFGAGACFQEYRDITIAKKMLYHKECQFADNPLWCVVKAEEIRKQQEDFFKTYNCGKVNNDR